MSRFIWIRFFSDSVKQYSLFPGQTVVMRGVNPRGDKFIAHEVFCDASLPVADHKADMMNTLNGMYVVQK